MTQALDAAFRVFDQKLTAHPDGQFLRLVAGLHADVRPYTEGILVTVADETFVISVDEIRQQL